MDGNGGTVYLGSNEDVAKRLGITPAGLRRLADIYGEVYEPLERDTHYNNRRLWTLEAVERLEAARGLVQADRGMYQSRVATAPSSSQVPQEALALPSKEVSKDPILLALVEHVQRLEARMELMQRQLEARRPETNEADELRRMNAYLLGERKRPRKRIALKRGGGSGSAGGPSDVLYPISGSSSLR